MAGFTDLVMRAQPRLADVDIELTEGRTFRVEIDNIIDAAGDLVDLTGATIVCKAITDIDQAEVVSFDTAGGLGTVSITKSAAGMAGVGAGATRAQPRVCLWFLKVTSGAQVAQFWGPAESNFIVYGE